MMKIPFLEQDVIENQSERLLESFSGKPVGEISVPIPVDEIAEHHLSLSLEFDDLVTDLGEDILGATWVSDSRVVIDETLDPLRYPHMEGRYHFTLAHELGHWLLHRPQLKSLQEQVKKSKTDSPCDFRRLAHSKKPMEWQADYFASCILMPREMVHWHWRRRFPKIPEIHFEDMARCAWAYRRKKRGGLVKAGGALRRMKEPQHVWIFEEVAKEFTRIFRVSAAAMRIRLETLGLLVGEERSQNTWEKFFSYSGAGRNP